MLHWAGKRPFTSTQYFPAQEKERHGEEVNDWMNELYWGDNLQVMSHLLKKYRGRVNLIYIDPPFDSKADYKKTITLRGQKVENDHNYNVLSLSADNREAAHISQQICQAKRTRRIRH